MPYQSFRELMVGPLVMGTDASRVAGRCDISNREILTPHPTPLPAEVGFIRLEYSATHTYKTTANFRMFSSFTDLPGNGSVRVLKYSDSMLA